MPRRSGRPLRWAASRLLGHREPHRRRSGGQSRLAGPPRPVFRPAERSHPPHRRCAWVARRRGQLALAEERRPPGLGAPARLGRAERRRRAPRAARACTKPSSSHPRVSAAVQASHLSSEAPRFRDESMRPVEGCLRVPLNALSLVQRSGKVDGSPWLRSLPVVRFAHGQLNHEGMDTVGN